VVGGNSIRSNFSQIESHVVKFYKNSFGSAEVKKASLHPDFWNENYVLSNADRLELEKSFTEEEIHIAVFGSEASGYLVQMASASYFISTSGH
jgi:hypothetical protein